MGRSIAFVGLLVSVPTWVLWLAAAHSHSLPEAWETWLLGVLCVGMGLGFVAAIGYCLRAALETGRPVYWLGFASASISEAIVFGTLIHHRTAGEFVGDMLGVWSVWLYIAIGGAYVLSVVALPPAADDEMRGERERQEEQIANLEAGTSAMESDLAKALGTVEQQRNEIQRLLVEAAGSGRKRKTLAARLLEAALAEPEWLDAEEWALRADMTPQQARSAVAKLGDRMGTHYTDEGRAMYAAVMADGSLPERET